MDDTTIDADAKHRIKDALIARASAGLHAEAASADREHVASEVDPDDSTDASETAQSSAALGYAGELDDAADRQRAELQAIQDLDVSPTDTVGPGAIIGFGGGRYLVGVVAEPFDCDGQTYEGLSTDSPAYAALAGLHAGDTFTVRDHEHTVDLVS